MDQVLQFQKQFVLALRYNSNTAMQAESIVSSCKESCNKKKKKKTVRGFSHKHPPETVIAFVLEFVHHPDSIEYSSNKPASCDGKQKSWMILAAYLKKKINHI